jgi:hypothetical protein
VVVAWPSRPSCAMACSLGVRHVHGAAIGLVSVLVAAVVGVGMVAVGGNGPVLEGDAGHVLGG